MSHKTPREELAEAAAAGADPQSLSIEASVLLEQHSQERIAEWWRRADELPHYPCSTDVAVRLVHSVEYDIDVEKVLRYIQDGLFDGPPMRNGRRCWTATDIVRLASLLEYRREWRPLSPLHDAKKSQFQRILEQAQASGVAVRDDLHMFDIRGLLAMMAECETPAMRAGLSEVILAKLAVVGVKL